MSYVYKFIDYQDNIIYIGKTNNLEKRMQQHFFRGHLDKECYNHVKQIFFMFVDGKTNVDMMETFLINKYHPKYNTEKQFNEILKLHNNDFLSYEEGEWLELYFVFRNNNIILSTKPIKPRYYDTSLTYKDRCVELIEHNIEIMKHCMGFYEYFFNNVISEMEEFLQYFILIHKEIMNGAININESNVDEPICEENSYEYIAFNINGIKTINLRYLLLLSQMHLIVHLNGDYYCLIGHNKYVFKRIVNETPF